MRPPGDITRALADAAREPGTVVQLAQRAQVSLAAARYTASRMVGRGELAVVLDGRPAVLSVPQAATQPIDRSASGLMEALDAIGRSFWERKA